MDDALARLAALIPDRHHPIAHQPGVGFALLDPWPAVLRADVVDYAGLPVAQVLGIATTCVEMTEPFLLWLASRDADGFRFGAHVVQPLEGEGRRVAVHVRWGAPLDGLTAEGFAKVLHLVGEQAKASCIQLGQRFGAEVPSSM